ncbi:hypothetical protein [Streptomyces sp. WAC04114]|uniref:hypothetical protein n=1 Tax=Streptomyces sp. WAC04114 TaxID=2867961 RepID=UPI001C8B8D59|nr:hypothetical protein [Streptomyces sp. WAC04114]MBX9365578.1 hypothetical protein [Streptomyces sp. WAC04114]
MDLPDSSREYTQDWAHAFMADPDAWPRFPFDERHGPTSEEMKAATEATGPTTFDRDAVAIVWVVPPLADRNARKLRRRPRCSREWWQPALPTGAARHPQRLLPLFGK